MFSSNTSQVSSDAVYVEDVFSNFLYTGVGGAQTVSTGIDLATYGGLLWNKNRTNAISNVLTDTVRGANAQLVSNTTAAQGNYGVGLSFLTNGFSLSSVDSAFNTNGANYASWTFRKQPKFFDVVTFTAGSGSTVFNHNLGSTPGCVIFKNITGPSDNWYVWHKDLTTNRYICLNLTNAQINNGAAWCTPTSTNVTVTDSPLAQVGYQYVAYLFAHNAGGFGLTGTDNVISCGSYTGNGSTTGPSVTLGYEPQWVLIKRASGGTQNWIITDNMRDFSLNGNARLFANLSDAESAVAGIVQPNATGFSINGTTGSEYNASGNTYIYIAIRRGPMKTPTSGTSVFAPVASSNDSVLQTTNFPVDAFIGGRRAATFAGLTYDRLRGSGFNLRTNTTDAEVDSGVSSQFTSNVGFTPNIYGASSVINWAFQRAPGFFDEVCYTGTGSATTVTHNLGVAPELMIVKLRSGTINWAVGATNIGWGNGLLLDDTQGATARASFFNSTAPTASVFTVGTNSATNGSGSTYVAYLFASCPGVSKVGSYTGNGSSQTINCGFTGGARFVMIKRTDSTGDWYVWDTARGIVSANDPQLSLNSTAAEVTTDDSIDPDNSGFIVNQVSATNINVSSATYIYLAIA